MQKKAKYISVGAVLGLFAMPIVASAQGGIYVTGHDSELARDI